MIDRIRTCRLKNDRYWDVIRDHLLFLIQQLLQRFQQKTKTLMTEIINPTRKKTERCTKSQLHNIQSK